MQTPPIATELFVGLTAIVAAAEEGSATRAASRLGVTTATALRRIEGAEQALGVRLFERLPTGLEPTAALDALLPWAVQALAAARGMLSEVAEGLEPGVGVVRITSAPVVSAHILAPAARDFNAAHPGITLELAGSTATAHLERLEADIAIRAFKPAQGDLVVRKLLDFDLVIAGRRELAPAYTPRALGALPWLTWAREMDALPEAQWLTHATSRARVVLRATELTTLLEAARAGVGVILIPAPLAHMEGMHVIDPAPPLSPRGSLWMLAHRALRDVARVDVVWRWLIDYLGELERAIG